MSRRTLTGARTLAAGGLVTLLSVAAVLGPMGPANAIVGGTIANWADYPYFAQVNGCGAA
jgi:hypothetical protein